MRKARQNFLKPLGQLFRTSFNPTLFNPQKHPNTNLEYKKLPLENFKQKPSIFSQSSQFNFIHLPQSGLLAKMSPNSEKQTCIYESKKLRKLTRAPASDEVLENFVKDIQFIGEKYVRAIGRVLGINKDWGIFDSTYDHNLIQRLHVVDFQGKINLGDQKIVIKQLLEAIKQLKKDNNLDSQNLFMLLEHKTTSLFFHREITQLFRKHYGNSEEYNQITKKLYVSSDRISSGDQTAFPNHFQLFVEKKARGDVEPHPLPFVNSMGRYGLDN